MNAEFFQSWKGSLAIAAVVVIAITGYKVAFRPNLETRIAERRIALAFPNGEPSETLRNRVVVENMTALNLHFTLDELARYFKSNQAEIVWEPENDRIFILRTTRFDPLTQQTNEFAFRLMVQEQSELPKITSEFQSGAIAVSALALNSEAIDARTTQTFLFQLENEIAVRKSQGQL